MQDLYKLNLFGCSICKRLLFLKQKISFLHYLRIITNSVPEFSWFFFFFFLLFFSFLLLAGMRLSSQ